MEEKIVKVTIEIEESKITDLTDYATSLGGSVSAVEKQLKFEDLEKIHRTKMISLLKRIQKQLCKERQRVR